MLVVIIVFLLIYIFFKIIVFVLINILFLIIIGEVLGGLIMFVNIVLVFICIFLLVVV